MDLPTNNLTMDIVREIFKYFSTPLIIPIPDFDQDSTRDLRHWRPFPWYLGHICSSWRTTFFSMYSEFWSTITISARHRYSCSAWEGAVSVAKMFLDRTEGRPFSFSVDTRHPCPPILDLFIAESTRWKRVSLHLADDDENILLFRSIKGKIPQVCSLDVNIELGMPRDLPLIFEDVPALTHLSLIHLDNWRMDWNLLTELELSCEFNVDRLLRVLSQASNLERLAFNRLTVIPKRIREKSFEPVTLPRLRTLEVSGFVILKFLTTPALQGLYIYKSSDHEPVDEPCASFFTRSSCQLERFGTIRFWPNDFVKILPYMPGLRVLTVCNPATIPIPELVKVLTCRTGGQPLVPQLLVLRLSDRIWSKVDELEIILESRASDRFMHSVQELKVIVTNASEWHWDKRSFKHANLRYVKNNNLSSYDISSQFQWIRDDLNC